MKIILLFFLFIVSPLHAAPILISSETKTEFIEREFIKDCEYVDSFKETTTRTFEDKSQNSTPDGYYAAVEEYSNWLWNNRKLYPGFANPCYYNKDGSFTDSPPDYCSAPVYNAFLQTPESSSSGGSYRYTEMDTLYSKVRVDNCDDCDHNPPTSVPEPETWSLVLIGIFFIIITQVAKKIIEFNRSSRKIF